MRAEDLFTQLWFKRISAEHAITPGMPEWRKNREQIFDEILDEWLECKAIEQALENVQGPMMTEAYDAAHNQEVV